MKPTRVFRQVEEGEKIELTLVRDEGERLPYYIDRRFDTPVREGWRVESTWQSNWDGGPGLRRDVRVCDRAEPHDVALLTAAPTLARAEQLALELVEQLRPWGAVEPRVFVWQLGGIDRVGNARDVLHEVDSIMRELAELGTDVVPRELEDPYGAYGPDGPPLIPAALVGRRIADLADVSALRAAIAALGVYIAVSGDEVRLALKT